MVNIDDTIYYLNRSKEEDHVKEHAKSLDFPYIDLAGYTIVKEVLDLVPENIAITYKLVPYLKIGSQVKVGMVDINDQAAKDYLEARGKELNLNFVISLMSQTSLMYGVNSYETIKVKEFKERAAKTAVSEEKDVDIKDIKGAAEAAKTVSLTKLLDILLLSAIHLKASDIHFEPQENDFITRYRIDGVLQDVVLLPLAGYKQVVSRIKYLSKLRMDISDKPQDGRFSFDAGKNGSIDFRVSLMPSAYGESIVLRLLGQEKSILDLANFGFRPDALRAINDAITKPHGMILTSGPTGSGKSSTLYAILKEVKKPGIKIITLEDPVEYKIEGIEQSQVKPDGGYTFADGLRASLRQDPDILMVGEIRDQETAEIAVQAALTGHLLLSTIHANSAPAVYARLLEIGVKPFLLSGSIILIMAQRLVRKNCPFCQEKYVPSQEDWKDLLIVLGPLKQRLNNKYQAILESQSPLLTRGHGCDKCNNSGYSGRQILIEILPPNDTIDDLISKKASISEFEKVAVATGMITMQQDGLLKALSGVTTIDEVWRVTKG